MINSKLLASLAPLITLLIPGLVGWLWLLGQQSIIGGFSQGVLLGFLPTVWIGVTILKRRCRIGEARHQMLMSSISLAGVILAAPLMLVIASHYHLVSAPVSDRFEAVMLGAFLVVIGNALPKTLGPLGENLCPADKEQKLKRFAGWMFVLAGLGYALIWLVLPRPLAHDLAPFVLMGPVLLALARMLRFMFWRSAV